jgi:putative ABC transport system permease protein
MLQDLRYAGRMLVKNPGFSAVAILALSLGIGMNTTVFTLVNAVLIRGLPYEDSHQILHLDIRNTASRDEFPVSWPEYVEWRTRTRSFTSLAAYRNTSMTIVENSRPPERYSGAQVTPDLFSLLRVPPLLGRDFRDDDGQPNAAPVLLISYAAWTSRYGSDPHIVGHVVKVNDIASTIIGVMPPDMRFPQNHDVWRPLIPDAALQKKDSRSLRVMGRLAPGVTRSQAQVEMSGIARALHTEWPDTNKDMDAQLLTFNERFNGGEIRIMFLALMGAVGFVLLIACANVANLLLARSTQRAREVAVRVALGASRMRVVRQLLIESTLLAFIGGSLGLLLTWFGVRAFDAAVEGSGKPYWITFSMDLAVFGYMAAICVATGIIFGLAPALQVTKTNVNEILKEGGRGSSGGRRARWMRSSLVVVELALTVVLLIGAGLMLRSFLKLYDFDLGAQHAEHLLTLRVDVPSTKYTTPDQRIAAYDRIVSSIQRTPGVATIALADALPMGGGSNVTLEIDGRQVPTDTPAPSVISVTVTPSYFDTVGAPVRVGRTLDELDGSPGRLNVVINQALATRFFSMEDPIGRRIRLVNPRNPQTAAADWFTIVGVSATVRQGDPQALEPAAVVYRPHRQLASAGMAILVRATGDPGSLANPVRQAVQAVEPDQPVYAVRTINDALAQARWPYRVFGSMFAIFAIIALALSAVGIYAVTSYAVTQRTPEIGVRMALGAAPQQVRWLVLRQGLGQLAIGLAIGLTLGGFLSNVLKTLVVQIPARDPLTFGVITVLLSAVMLVACLVPARRATRLDPLTALRVE